MHGGRIDELCEILLTAVGCLLQTQMLVATSLGMKSCVFGAVEGEAFAKAFGTECEVRIGDDCRFTLKSVKSNDVADALQKMMAPSFDNLLHDCLQIREERQLSDWAYYEMLSSLVDNFYGKDTNEATLALAFLSCRGRKVYLYGDTRVIHCREELHLHHWSQNIYCKEEESQCYRNNALSVAYRPVKKLCIVDIQQSKSFVYRIEDCLVYLSLMRVETEQLRAEHRNEGERTNC